MPGLGAKRRCPSGHEGEGPWVSLRGGRDGAGPWRRSHETSCRDRLGDMIREIGTGAAGAPEARLEASLEAALVSPSAPEVRRSSTQNVP